MFCVRIIFSVARSFFYKDITAESLTLPEMYGFIPVALKLILLLNLLFIKYRHSFCVIRIMILPKDFFARLLCLFNSSLFTLMLVTSFAACAQKAVHTTSSSNSGDIDTEEMGKNILD